ncbi:biosynthetic-type acetolactate synthase large subunit [Candidatus Woesearchaeota archaeon]|nr:biosynthetic-type acetolactate synthase large subunit [Candidatus Woesearchaeota archaeon]
MASITGGRGVVEALLDEGVRHAFGIPGGANLPFYDELYKESGIEHIHMKHEQCGAHAATGYARVLGKVGVCIGTSGPGTTNLVTGITDAFMDSIPLVALTGQVPTKLLGKDAFQESDNFGFCLPVTKHNFRLGNAEESYATTREAFLIARSGRPGPVAIDLPKDTIANQFELDKKKYKPLYSYKPAPLDRIKIKEAVQLLFNAERPMMLGGGGVTLSGASHEFTAFAELLNCYAVTTITARGAIPTTHPLSLGQIGMHGRQVSNHSVANCDVLLAVGTRFSDRITGDISAFAPKAKIIHIDVDPTEIGKNVPVNIGIAADAKTALRELLNAANEMRLKGSQNLWRERIKQLNAECACNCGYDEVPIRPETILKEVNEAIPEDIIVTTEVGHHQMYATHFLKVKDPRHFITSAGLGTMGFGLPAAIGAKIAKPELPVLDLSGDGSLFMVCQELSTAAERELPIVIALFNNGGYSIVKEWQRRFYGQRHIAVEFGKTTDWVKVAKGFGCDGIRVSKPSEIQAAMKQALKSDKPFLIDIPTQKEHEGIPLVPPLGKNTEMLLTPRCPLVKPGYFDGK